MNVKDNTCKFAVNYCASLLEAPLSEGSVSPAAGGKGLPTGPSLYHPLTQEGKVEASTHQLCPPQQTEEEVELPW